MVSPSVKPGGIYQITLYIPFDIYHAYHPNSNFAVNSDKPNLRFPISVIIKLHEINYHNRDSNVHSKSYE